VTATGSTQLDWISLVTPSPPAFAACAPDDGRCAGDGAGGTHVWSASPSGWRFQFRRRPGEPATPFAVPEDDMTDTRAIWFESSGTRLHAVERGEGPPIILLHGGLVSHVACDPLAIPLAERFRVITPDQRGSGRSVYRERLSWTLLADDVAALARHLGIERAVIAGTSFGAGGATAVALRHPAIVAGVAIVNPAYGGAELGLLPAQRQAMDAMHAAGSRAPAEGVRVLHPLFAALPPPVQARVHAMIDGFDPASVAATTAFLASGEQPFARGEDLAAITAPALLVPGLDAYHPPEVTDVFRRHLRRATERSITSPWDPELAAILADFAARAAAG
jgi:pimeloyl-ACP methyl ester carboxylesterase